MVGGINEFLVLCKILLISSSYGRMLFHCFLGSEWSLLTITNHGVSIENDHIVCFPTKIGTILGFTKIQKITELGVEGKNLNSMATKTKVSNCFELGSATFWAGKRQKAPKIFFKKKRHNFSLKRHNCRNSSQKMTPHTNFIAFLCDNFLHSN